MGMVLISVGMVVSLVVIAGVTSYALYRPFGMGPCSGVVGGELGGQVGHGCGPLAIAKNWMKDTIYNAVCMPSGKPLYKSITYRGHTDYLSSLV